MDNKPRDNQHLKIKSQIYRLLPVILIICRKLLSNLFNHAEYNSFHYKIQANYMFFAKMYTIQRRFGSHNEYYIKRNYVFIIVINIDRKLSIAQIGFIVRSTYG